MKLKILGKNYQSTDISDKKEAKKKINRPWPCDLCDKAFTIKPHLKRHVENVHQALKPYYCCECHKTYSQDANLRRHQRSAHPQFNIEKTSLELERAVHDREMKLARERIDKKLKKMVEIRTKKLDQL